MFHNSYSSTRMIHARIVEASSWLPTIWRYVASANQLANAFKVLTGVIHGAIVAIVARVTYQEIRYALRGGGACCRKRKTKKHITQKRLENLSTTHNFDIFRDSSMPRFESHYSWNWLEPNSSKVCPHYSWSSTELQLPSRDFQNAHCMCCRDTSLWARYNWYRRHRLSSLEWCMCHCKFHKRVR